MPLKTDRASEKPTEYTHHLRMDIPQHFEKKRDQKYLLEADLRPSNDATLTQKVPQLPQRGIWSPNTKASLCISLYLVIITLDFADGTPFVRGVRLWSDVDQCLINIF